MKKKYFAMLKFIFGLAVLFFILIGCEPVSVSVNSDGEIAFTRSEGVFFINIKSSKITLLDWNYSKETIPVIIRWSPKGDMLAYTVKDSKDSQNTNVFIINKKGEKNKVYSVANIITQMEWSPDGKYLSLAQAGKDTDLGVADLVFVSAADGLSKVFMENCGDVHKWLSEKSICFVKINKKNPNNSDIFSGDLSLYTVDTQKTDVLKNIFLSKTGGLDCNKAKGEIIFTALKVFDKTQDFDQNMTTDSNAFLYAIKDKKISKLSDDIINFVLYSPDGNNVLLKSKDKENASNFNLSYYNINNKTINLLVKNTVDTITSNSSTVQVYPNWLNNENVLFWRINKNYGSNGEALILMSMNIISSKKQNLQVLIDSEVNKIVESKGGY